MLYLFHSNRLENLVERLAATLARPLDNSLAAQTIVVPSAAMQRWLSLKIADLHGIASNLEYLYPAELVWWLYRRQLGDVPQTNEFDVPTLTWRVLTQLEQQGEYSVDGELGRYLQSSDARSRWQLARRLAQMYEQYLLYRPDWIIRWQRGSATDDWQANLWRKLTQAGGNRHWLTLQKRFFETLDTPANSNQLPSRLSLFALPSVSPTYLQTIQRVAEKVDIFFYVLNPSPTYWSQIASEKETMRAVERDGTDVTAYFDTGNTLLAGSGRQQREYLDLLLELEGHSDECFTAPDETTLLGRIQHDVFRLNDRKAQTLSADDHSIQLHSCHSRLRELEVLHDRLLDLLERNPQITPGEVRILAPNIVDYAAAIEAVFGAASADRYIPFAVVDGAPLDNDPLVRAFFSLLDLAGERFDANRVIDLLDYAALRRRFRIEQSDLTSIYDWIATSGIGWGIDEASITEHGLPPHSVNTWRAAIQRLLLGHALPTSDELFMDRLAYPLLDTDQSRLAGSLVTFLSRLFELKQQFSGRHTPAVWSKRLNTMLDLFFDVGDIEEASLNRLREAIENTLQTTIQAGYDEPIDGLIFRLELDQYLQPTSNGVFASGRATFANLAIGRSLPTAVVCLIGLNDQEFPRIVRVPGFDRMVQAPRPGDRRRRDEDRYLFLESILSARLALYISYCGRHVRDDTPTPPSVLVSELLDYIDRTSVGCDGLPRHQLLIEHPLQSFSHRYFIAPDEGRYFSYASERRPVLDAPQILMPPAILTTRLTDEAPEVLTLQILADFFSNPARYLLRQRLGVRLERTRPVRDSLAACRSDFDARLVRRQTLLSVYQDDSGFEVAEKKLRAQALLAPGAIGQLALESEWLKVADLADRIDQAAVDQPQQRFAFERVIDGIRLTGQLMNVGQHAQYRHSLLPLVPSELLSTWIDHLALNLSPQTMPHRTTLVAFDKSYVLHEVTSPETMLTELLEWYRLGQKELLPFFPRSAHAYATTSGDALLAATRRWQSSEYAPGEDRNPWYQLAFRHQWSEQPDTQFATLSEKIYAPVVEHLEALAE